MGERAREEQREGSVKHGVCTVLEHIICRLNAQERVDWSVMEDWIVLRVSSCHCS